MSSCVSFFSEGGVLHEATFRFVSCVRELVSSCETETERVQGVSSGRQDTHQRRQSEREEEGEREWYVRGTKSGRGVT